MLEQIQKVVEEHRQELNEFRTELQSLRQWVVANILAADQSQTVQQRVSQCLQKLELAAEKIPTIQSLIREQIDLSSAKMAAQTPFKLDGIEQDGSRSSELLSAPADRGMIDSQTIAATDVGELPSGIVPSAEATGEADQVAAGAQQEEQKIG